MARHEKSPGRGDAAGELRLGLRLGLRLRIRPPPSRPNVTIRSPQYLQRRTQDILRSMDIYLDRVGLGRADAKGVDDMFYSPDEADEACSGASDRSRPEEDPPPRPDPTPPDGRRS